MLKKLTASLTIALTTFALSLGVFLAGPVDAACAAAQPHLTARYLVTNLNRDNGNWKHDTSAQPGDILQFYVELHNTEVGTVANNPKVKVTVTQGEYTNGSSFAVYTADNANNTATDKVNLNLSQVGHIGYMQGTTRLWWDPNGDGVFDYSNTPVSDGIAAGGLSLPGGAMNGCNKYIAQVSFRARVVSNQPTPTPTPTPTPVVSPSPTPRVTPTPTPTPVVSPSPTPVVTPTPVVSPTPTPQGQVSCPAGFNQQVNGNVIVCVQNNNNNENTNNNNNSQDQSQEMENNQTVNITNSVPTATVAGVSVPLKTPETGVGVLGMATMFSAAPIGLALARYGRGRLVSHKKDEEDLMEIANSLVTKRGKSN